MQQKKEEMHESELVRVINVKRSLHTLISVMLQNDLSEGEKEDIGLMAMYLIEQLPDPPEEKTE